MKKLFANSLSKNPEGWAGKAVGAPWRYRFAQAITVFGGIALFLIFLVVSRRHSYGDYLGIGVLIFAFSVAFPLMYLKALRHFVMKNGRLQTNQQGAKGNQ